MKLNGCPIIWIMLIQMGVITMKLTSRKFWLSIAGFICMMIVYWKSGKSESAITGCLSLITYVLGESYADGQSARGEGHE